jgi:hypothetical protein
MSYTSRHGKRWNTPEILTLHREFDLLNLSVEEIALRHQRSVDSILFKLQSEGLMTLNSNNIQLELESDADSSSDYQDEIDSDDDSDYQDEDEDQDDDDSSMPSLITIDDENSSVECVIDKLSDRVWNLETSVGEISTMVKQIFEKISSEKKSKKLAPLRKSTF